MKTKPTFRVEFAVKGTVNISYHIPADSAREALEIAEQYMIYDPSHFYICKIEKISGRTIINNTKL